MCLKNITELHVDPIDTEWKTGYKVFSKERNGEYRGIFYTFFLYKMNEEYQEITLLNQPALDYIYSFDTDCEHYEDLFITYQKGFHIFLTKEDALDYYFTMRNCPDFQYLDLVIVKVEYCAVTAVGLQEINYKKDVCLDCVVARKMKLVEEIY